MDKYGVYYEENLQYLIGCRHHGNIDIWVSANLFLWDDDLSWKRILKNPNISKKKDTYRESQTGTRILNFKAVAVCVCKSCPLMSPPNLSAVTWHLDI